MPLWTVVNGALFDRIARLLLLKERNPYEKTSLLFAASSLSLGLLGLSGCEIILVWQLSQMQM